MWAWALQYGTKDIYANALLKFIEIPLFYSNEQNVIYKHKKDKQSRSGPLNRTTRRVAPV